MSIFYLPYKKPFSWENHLKFYSYYSTPNLEHVSGNMYERVFETKHGLAHILVEDCRSKSKLKVKFEGHKSLEQKVKKKLRWMFDLDIEPKTIRLAFKRHRFLFGLLEKYPGLRLSKSWDVTECLVGTVLSQLVSIKQARNLITELVDNYGRGGVHPITKEKIMLFPRAEVMAKSNLLKVRTTLKRRQTIKAVARMMGKLEKSKDLSEELLKIKGIGPWTAYYASMRLGDTDAFPASDLALARMIKRYKSLKKLDTVKPFRSYAAIYVWKHYQSGAI